MGVATLVAWLKRALEKDIAQPKGRQKQESTTKRTQARMGDERSSEKQRMDKDTGSMETRKRRNVN
jgi:hypothetical protein